MDRFILFIILTLYLNANTYFVSTKGNDKNSGTKVKPFATLKKAIQIAKAGDIINIRGGEYPFENKFNISGEEDKPITFQSYRYEKVIFVGPYGEDKIYNTNQNSMIGTFLVTGSYLKWHQWDIYQIKCFS